MIAACFYTLVLVRAAAVEAQPGPAPEPIHKVPGELLSRLTFEYSFQLFGRPPESLNRIEQYSLALSLDLTRARVLTEIARRGPEWQEQVQRWQNFTESMGQIEKERGCIYKADWIGVLEPIVVPRLKLAMCYVPKVACTAFKDLFNALNHLKGAPVGFGDGYLWSMRSRLPQELLVPADKITRERGWKFATFTRDPLDRYLSAFGSTCVQKATGETDHPMECCGTVVSKDAPQEIAKEVFAERALEDMQHGLPSEEQHWSPQARILFNCGWDKFAPGKVDFRGHLHEPTMNAQVRQMLDMVNASKEDLLLVDRFFPHQQAKVENRNPLRTLAMNRSMFYEDPKVRRLVKEIYQMDYALIPDVDKYATTQGS